MNKPYVTYESDIYYHVGLAYCNVEKFEKSIYPYSRVRLFKYNYSLDLTSFYSVLK